MLFKIRLNHNNYTAVLEINIQIALIVSKQQKPKKPDRRLNSNLVYVYVLDTIE